MDERIVNLYAEQLATAEYGMTYWAGAVEELRESWREVARRYMWIKREQSNPLHPVVNYRPPQVTNNDDFGGGDGRNYEDWAEPDERLRRHGLGIGRGVLSSQLPSR